jgi:hypothetical protein
VLADGNSLGAEVSGLVRLLRKCHAYLLDQHVEVFWDFWGKTCVTLSVLWTNTEALLCHLP